MTADQSLSSQRASNSSSTIKNSKTTPSAASNARRNARAGVCEFEPKLEPSVLHAVRKRPFRSALRRVDPCCADPVSKRISWCHHHRRLRPVRGLPLPRSQRPKNQVLFSPPVKLNISDEWVRRLVSAHPIARKSSPVNFGAARCYGFLLSARCAISRL